MEFLVHIVIDPAGVTGDDGAKRLAAERERGVELLRAGVMKRIWRIPGTNANWAVFEVDDATALHDLLSTMPLWGYIEFTVHALAGHPLEALAAEGAG